MMTGVSMLHVTYRGGAPALVDLLAGRVHVIFDTIPEAIGHIREGRLRALAVTTAARSPALPDVPPMRDFLPGFEAGSWWGLGAPKNTPPAVVNALNATLAECLRDPGFEMQLANLGATPLRFSPDEFRSFVEAETEKWATVVKFSGAKQW
jgi:tripartite-type tricarboxylate transporter receptor subunit TctC